MKRKYPAGLILLALITALIATWVPFLVLAAIGFLILGALKVWKVAVHGHHMHGTPTHTTR